MVVSAYGGNKDTDARFDNFRVTHFGAWDSQSALPSLESLACSAYPPVKIELPEELLFVPQE